ncbi:MAG TPA: capsule assembly Wzi family protein [Longimicrobiaceae bacterium]|nr:capsule assembly Wzi family protein [Longimicrobiaceae bacterium]
MLPIPTGARFRARALALALPALAASGLQAQEPDTVSAAGELTRLPTLGSPVEDRLRVLQLLGRASTDGYLIRSPSSQLPSLAGEGMVRWAPLAPEVRAAWNAALPFSLNDGALWAGRGMNAQATVGAMLQAGPVSLVLAPQLVYSQNLDFQTIPSDSMDRSAFAARWYVGTSSADVPLRFGNVPVLRLLPGQSTLSVRYGALAAGASTENQWWGPGIRNGIVMSNNAEGFPHLFLRTAAPLRTRLGAFEAKWIIGGLSESLYFDTVSTNNSRSLSGFTATYRPAAVPDLTLGLARVLYAGPMNVERVPLHVADAFIRWEAPQEPVRTAAPGDTTGRDTTFVWPSGSGREQMFSLFGRWVFPRDGFEIYGEWARTLLPTSLVDLLNAPNHTQGYTLGVQWARPVRRGDLFRLQTEVTYLEESATFDQRPVEGFYVSRSIPQGYTHLGKVIGAAVGPGGSGQWLAGDYLAGGWRLGAFGGRIRWNNDVYYDRPGGAYVAHDVSLFGGIRGGVRIWSMYLDVEYAGEQRYNYLFQNPETEVDGFEAVDKWNRSLRIMVTPR